jgi:outer membrane receptor for ferrienterochelin and colicin
MISVDKIDAILAANPDIEEVVAAAMHDVFYNSYERKFGSPTADVIERAEKANSAELAEWIPNIVNARNVEDVFVSGLELTLALYVASVVKEKFGINIDSVHKLTDISDAL